MQLIDPQSLRHLAEQHERSRRKDAAMERLVHRPGRSRLHGARSEPAGRDRSIISAVGARLRWVTSLR